MVQFRQDIDDSIQPKEFSFSVKIIRVLLTTTSFFVVPTSMEAADSVFSKDDPVSLALRETIRGTTSLALLPASPDCWLDAIQVLKINTGSVLEKAFHASSSADGSHTLNSVTCSWLTSVDQKVLALELSKCHMRDLGRNLFDFHNNNNEQDEKECDRALEEYRNAQEEPMEYRSVTTNSHNIATKCLAHLSDKGTDSYTHFFSYVNQLCTRLLSEFVLGQYYETSYHLARSSKVAEERIQSLIEQQDLLYNRWTERQDRVLGMYDQLESHVDNQTIILESEIYKVRMKLEEEHEHWNAAYIRFQEALATELDRHQNEFAFFSGLIRPVQNLMNLWTSKVDTLWSKIQMGHYLFRGVSMVAGGIICCYLLTYPRPLRWMRGSMAMLLAIEVIVEVAIVASMWDEENRRSELRYVYLAQCDTLRGWFFYLLCVYFAVGVLRSIAFGIRTETKESADTKEKDAICLENIPKENVENIQQTDKNQSEGQLFMPPFHPSMYEPHTHPHFSGFHNPMTSSTMQQPLFVYQPARTCSQNESAAASSESPETPDRRSVQPHLPAPFVIGRGLPAYAMYTPMIMQPPVVQQSTSILGFHHTPNQLTRTDSTADSTRVSYSTQNAREAENSTGRLPNRLYLPNSSKYSHNRNGSSTMYIAVAEDREMVGECKNDTFDQNDSMREGEYPAGKRLYTDVSEDPRENAPSGKRIRRAELDSIREEFRAQGTGNDELEKDDKLIKDGL